ncbi:MAG TPA: zinc ribbon domain-containing protein [Methanothrix sp.]|nr:zinc ribbon domain-containing protein [Methanothrix sp.]
MRSGGSETGISDEHYIIDSNGNRKELIKADPGNTTQRCSACASRVNKDLSVRVHECPYCGFSCNRDYNASRNILITGRKQPTAPIEPKPLHNISVRQVLAMKCESAPFRGQ